MMKSNSGIRSEFVSTIYDPHFHFPDIFFMAFIMLVSEQGFEMEVSFHEREYDMIQRWEHDP